GSTRAMKVSHGAAAVDVAFDDPNLIADAGLVPVLALAEQVGLPELVAEHVAITGAANGAGGEPGSQGDVTAGRDGDRGGLDRGHGPAATCQQQCGVRPDPCPLDPGTFLRAFTHGHVPETIRKNGHNNHNPILTSSTASGMIFSSSLGTNSSRASVMTFSK